MTRPEFNQWWGDFKLRWPQRVVELRKDKLTGQDRNEDDQKRLLRLWSEALDDVELPEALEVNRRWFAGELETPKWFHLEDTPSFVRQAAIAARPRPATWNGPDDADQDFRDLYAGKPGLLRRIVSSLEEGASVEEAAQRLTAEMGPKGTRRKERTYNCSVCLDEGRVEIWHPDCVYVAATEGMAAVNGFSWRVAVCGCFCKRGEKHCTRIPRYDILLHCRVYPRAGATGRYCDPKALEGLAEWIAGKRQRDAATGDPLFDQAGVN